MKPSREPTSEECTSRAVIEETSWGKWIAIWYPQMGGYGAHAAVHISDNGCFELAVWHDGEFPLCELNPGEPYEWHCCSAEQFVDFGNAVLAMQRKPIVITESYDGPSKPTLSVSEDWSDGVVKDPVGNVKLVCEAKLDEFGEIQFKLLEEKR